MSCSLQTCNRLYLPLPICLSVFLSPFIYLSISKYLPIYCFVYLSPYIYLSIYLFTHFSIFYLPTLLTHNYLHAPPSFASINCSGMEMKQSFREVVVNNIKSFLRHGVYHRIVDLYAVYKMDETFMTQNQGLRTHSDYAEFLGMV